MFGLGFMTTMLFVFGVGGASGCLQSLSCHSCFCLRSALLGLCIDMHGVRIAMVCAHPQALPGLPCRPAVHAGPCRSAHSHSSSRRSTLIPLLAVLASSTLPHPPPLGLLWPPPPAVFTSTWVGSVSIGMGEYIIKRVPLVRHIYSAAKQVRPSAPGRPRGRR